MVEEQCQQQLLLESSYIGATVCLWEKNSPTLIEEGIGKEAGEEPQKLILHPIPINLYPSATAQPKNNPLLVHILPTLAPHATPETPTVKAIPYTLPALQNLKKLVAFVQTFATTSKTLAAAHTAWHRGWFECWFRHGAPGPRNFYKIHLFLGKLNLRWTGPFTIQEVYLNGSVDLLNAKDNRVFKVNGQRLKPYAAQHSIDNEEIPLLDPP